MAARNTLHCVVSASIAVLLCSTFQHAAALSAGTRPDASSAALAKRLDLEEKEFKYLEANGFVNGHVINPDSPPSGGEGLEEAAEQAVASFQEFYKLPVTGVMDTVTKETMWKPRCGFPDVAVLEKEPAAVEDVGAGLADEGGRRRTRRFNDGGGFYKWNKRKITYSILNYPSRGKLKSYEVSDVIKRAFGVWARVAPLEFQRLDASLARGADIRVSFVRGSHSADKDHPRFDGPDGELAHAFSPNSGWGDVDGDIHFDDDEIFSMEESENRYNFFQIAAHEVGHSLGLDHSRDPMALMWPHYHYISNFRLPKDDVLGIQSLYGSRPGVEHNSIPVSHCVSVFDAVLSIAGVMYVFKGDRFWEVADGKIVADKDGRMTDDYWYDLPSRIDAAYHRSDGRTVFLKGAKYWVYHGRYRQPGYPRRVDELGLPNSVDAVLTYNSAKTYFFKKNQMWRFDEERQSVDRGYPKKLRRVFKGLPRRVMSAFRHTDGQLYFLSGKKYFRVNKRKRKVDKGYPRYFAKDFMGCSSVD